MGTDHTIFAVVEGQVLFKHKANGRITINVVEPGHEAAAQAPAKVAKATAAPAE